MTVGELINELHKYPQDIRVVVEGYENGYDGIETIETILLGLRADKQWLDGKYERQKLEKGTRVLALLGNRNRE